MQQPSGATCFWRKNANLGWTGCHHWHGGTPASSGAQVEARVGSLSIENGPVSIGGHCGANRTVSSKSLFRPGRTARRAHAPGRARPELPGVRLTPYRSTGFIGERVKLAPSVGSETPATPPSPVRARPRGGAPVPWVGPRRLAHDGRSSRPAEFACAGRYVTVSVLRSRSPRRADADLPRAIFHP